MYNEIKTENREYQVLLMLRCFQASSVLDYFSTAMWKSCNHLCDCTLLMHQQVQFLHVFASICIPVSGKLFVTRTSDYNLHFVQGCISVITLLQSSAFCALTKLRPRFKTSFPVCWKHVKLKVIIRYYFICHI